MTARAAALVLGAALAAGAPAAQAVEVEDLYVGRTIVTGQDNLAERARGLRLALSEVLVKVSGDATLADDPGLAAVLDDAESYLAGLEYEDRKKGIQISDEQGTRDRSFVFRATFDAAKIDAVLADLGRRKWAADRPRLAVWLGVRNPARAFVVCRDGEFGYGQREALRSAARRLGVPIALPAVADVEAVAIDPALIAAGAADALRAASPDADGLLYGILVLDRTAYWTAEWTLDAAGVVERWRLDGVTFDVALRDAIARAAGLLSAR